MTPATAMIHPSLQGSVEFLDFLVSWEEGLAAASLRTLIEEAGGPQHVAIVSVDMIKGFTSLGPLSHPRVAALVPPIVRLVREAHVGGVRNFVFVQDAHPPDSPEFGAYPMHCVEGTEEAEMVDELAALPFAERCFHVIPKRSIDAAMGTALTDWLDAHPDIRCVITVGDCTDICLYALAMHLKVRANVHRHPYQVVVAADCANTYDLPVQKALAVGAMPHDGNLLHLVFLYQMALNGISVVRSISPVDAA